MYKLHRSGIVLRCLDLDAIGLRQSSENPNEYKFDKIITYSFARCLKVGDGILQQLHMTGESKVAPEIEAGELHDFSVDVWSLGRIA